MLWWLVVLMLGYTPGAQAAGSTAPGRAAEVAEASVSALAGAWTGQWGAKDSAATGPVEVIFTDETDRGTTLAHFTFMDGAKTFTSRREGVVIDGHVRFEAPDDGEIVLRLVAPGRLVGDFSSGPTLPAREGVIEVTRTRQR